MTMVMTFWVRTMLICLIEYPLRMRIELKNSKFGLIKPRGDAENIFVSINFQRSIIFTSYSLRWILMPGKRVSDMNIFIKLIVTTHQVDVIWLMFKMHAIYGGVLCIMSNFQI